MQPKALGTFDYIIVGAGSSGCALAGRLSEDPQARVLLVEAGGSDDWHWIQVPGGIFYLLGNPRCDWNFLSEPEPGLNGRIMPIPRGKVVGGSSSINGMAYVRGQARDYDHWHELGNKGWSWNEVLPYFKKSEHFIDGPDEVHGAGGRLHVQRLRVKWKVLDAMRNAAREAGMPNTEDFNRGSNDGCAYLHVTQRNARRWSSFRAFVKPILSRPNLTLLKNSQVSRVVIREDRATSIEFFQEDTPGRADATGEVILSAGTIGSPHLLQLSGIGPGELLRNTGIPVVRDIAGVGENLQDHLNARFVQRLARGDTLNTRFNSPLLKALMGAQYYLSRSGPMASGVPPLSGFAKSDPSRETANLQFHANTASYETLGAGLHKFPAIGGGICNLRPRSRGYVRVKSLDPRTYPRVLHNYLMDRDDQRVAIDSIRLMRRIFSAPSLAPYDPSDYLPPKDCESDEALLENIKATAWTAFHPVGTCKMGSDALSVVDERLRVRGVRALRIVDASIMPTLVSGNTNAPAIMIGEKAADLIKDDRRRAV